MSFWTSKDYVRDSGRKVDILRVGLMSDRIQAHRRWIVGASLIAFVIVSICVIAALGWIWTWRALFSNNPRFTIASLDIDGSATELVDYLKHGKNIGPGSNLFGFSLREIQKDILRNAPQYLNIKISRRLPDTVVVRTEERIPLARISAGRKKLVVDKEGMVFVQKAGSAVLPTLIGCDGNLVPGQILEGMSSAAIEVFEICSNPELGLKIDSIDVSFSDCLLLTIDGKKVVKFKWDGMERRDQISRQNLELCVARLSRAIKAPRAAAHDFFDATYPDMDIIVGR